MTQVVYSVTRIALAYGAGFGFIILMRFATELFRQDIVDKYNRPVNVVPEDLRETYDFIVIGAGSAGAAVASRLSEIRSWKILLIEAGDDEPILSDPPITFPILQKTPMDWQFKTEPSGNFCLSMNEQRCCWPRGRVMGGSSTMNGMVYVRGNKKDFDAWERLGNPGWGFDQVLNYFKKSEDMNIENLKDDPYHGNGGYLTIEDYRYHTPLAFSFLEAAQQLGHRIVDVNGATQTGFTLSHGTLRNGLRCSTSKAFIRPVVHRNNLHISMQTFVEKILIRKGKRQAYGVVVNKAGKGPMRIYAKKEVILSAGSIQSPQLLMLSGVGPRKHLADLRIPVVVDSPGVGANLQDHIAMGGTTFLIDGPTPPDVLGSGFVLPRIMNFETARRFMVDQDGPLYCFPEIEVMGFVHTKFSNVTDDWPDIQLLCSTYSDNTDGGVYSKRATGLTDEYYNQIYEPILYQDSFTIVPLLLRPRSRGRILLRAKDPYLPPLIYPNYFEHEDDIKVLIEGRRIVDDLVKTEALQRLNARLHTRRIPGCEELEERSDDYLECQARHHSLTIYHPVGTCKMGPKSDELAVVDSRLRVRGISGLRVIDASVMPVITSGNTNAPTIMIAEKGSDMIKEDWAGTL